MKLLWTGLGLALLWCGGCVLNDIDLSGKACPCVAGFVCTSEVCVREGVDAPVANIADGASPADSGSPVDAAVFGIPEGSPVDAAIPDGAVAVVDAGDPVRGIVESTPAMGCDPLKENPPCDPACSGGCPDGVCVIECNFPLACTLGTVKCPPGIPCVINCNGYGSCSAPVTLECNDGPCLILCSGVSACQGAVMHCGSGACRHECGTLNVLLNVDCDESCDCDPQCQTAI